MGKEKCLSVECAVRCANEMTCSCNYRAGTLIVIDIIIIIGFLIGMIVYAVKYNQCKEYDIWKPSYGKFSHAAVATDAGPCSTIGKDLLEKGGSAVDAAIGAALCVGVLNTHSTSVGGGSFISIYNATTGEAVYINARDVAPAGASRNTYSGQTDNQNFGALSIAVPGEIAGYWEAHRRYKKLEWREVFQPTIDMISNHPEVTEALGNALNKSDIDEKLHIAEYNLEPIFLDANGNAKVEGNTVPRAELGATLRRIANADNGRELFYEGDVAAQIIQDLTDAPGNSIITNADLSNYRVEVKQLIRIELGNLTVLTPGAPSGGPVLAYILNILKGYNFTSEDIKDTNSTILAYHRILEAFKFAYAKRAELGDPNFDSSGGVAQAVLDMTSDSYAETTRLRINDISTQASAYYGSSTLETPAEDSGTTHISVLDKDGSAVSITSSMNTYLGSKVRGLRTGIIFNNNMGDFNIPSDMSSSGSKNYIEGGKRPLSSMAPTIIIDHSGDNDTVKLVVGASGGIKIPTATAWATAQRAKRSIGFPILIIQ